MVNKMRILFGITLLILCLDFQVYAKNVAYSLKANLYRVGERVENLVLEDLNGQKLTLSEYMNDKNLVIFSHKHSCPVSRKYSPRISNLIKNNKNGPFVFLLVNTDPYASLETLRNEVSKYDFQAPYIPDFNSQLKLALFSQTTTESFVIDSKRTLVYRGPFDDQHGVGTSLPAPKNKFLEMAMNSVKEDKEVSQKAIWSPGCILGLDFPAENLRLNTFHNRISRIMQVNCQDCHRSGGIAPFPLMTYQDMKSHKGMIRWMVTENRMPPWFAHQDVGNFKNDRRLSSRDKKALLHWLNKPIEGDFDDAPFPRKWHNDWNIGKPDHIATIAQPIQIPADGIMPYQYIYVDPKLEKDRYIKAIEIKPMDAEVVHHIIVFLVDKDETQVNPNSLNHYFAGYVPGHRHTIYPKDIGRMIPKDKKFLFQIHYTPKGIPTQDKPELGMVFMKESPLHVVRTMACANRMFVIPPHHPNYEVPATFNFKRRGKILSFLPHMHLRGKSFAIKIVDPNGEEERQLWVPKYDFNWQLKYVLRQPFQVNPGSRLECLATYDNSDQNPYNPDPNQEVRYGEQTEQEMMFGFFEFYAL